jgi:hypothetical protein
MNFMEIASVMGLCRATVNINLKIARAQGASKVQSAAAQTEGAA